MIKYSTHCSSYEWCIGERTNWLSTGWQDGDRTCHVRSLVASWSPSPSRHNRRGALKIARSSDMGRCRHHLILDIYFLLGWTECTWFFSCGWVLYRLGLIDLRTHSIGDKGVKFWTICVYNHWSLKSFKFNVSNWTVTSFSYK